MYKLPMIVLEWSPLVRFNIRIISLKCSIITLHLLQAYWKLHEVYCDLFFCFSFPLLLPLVSLPFPFSFHFSLTSSPLLLFPLCISFSSSIFFSPLPPPTLTHFFLFVCFSLEVGRDNGGGGRFLPSLTDISFASVNWSETTHSQRSHRESFVLILDFLSKGIPQNQASNTNLHWIYGQTDFGKATGV